ncbi:hypothetical protein D3C73_1178840 [compost metagenome]
MTDPADQHRQEQATGQRLDHGCRQAEVGNPGGGDHGQADHQEGDYQVVAATLAVAKDHQQAQADQQHAAERVVTQQRDQQQADAGGQHGGQCQHQGGLEGQRTIDADQEQCPQHRRQKRDGHPQAKTHRQAQCRATGQAQRALHPRRAFSRHTTASSSATGTTGPAGSVRCLRQGRP